MRMLLVVDGSSYSDMATKMLEALRLPSRIEVTVLTVVPEHTFLGGITLGKLKGVAGTKEAQQQKALEQTRYCVEPAVGFEPTTSGLRNRCSTPELRWHISLNYS